MSVGHATADIFARRPVRPAPLELFQSPSGRWLAAVGLLASATALSALSYRGQELARSYETYFVAVMLCAVFLGTSYGIVAAIASIVILRVAVVGVDDGFNLQSAVINLSTVLIAARVLDFYLREEGRHRRVLNRLALVDKEHVLDAPTGARGELWGLAAGGAFAVAGVLLAFAWHSRFGMLPASGIVVAAIACCAATLGLRHALACALLSVALFDFLMAEPRFTLHLNSGTTLVNVTIFLATAWWVGALSDEVRRDHQVSQILYVAGRAFSSLSEESALRRELAKWVCAANDGRLVRVTDEDGRHIAVAGSLPRGLEPDDSEAAPAAWRSQPLETAGRSLGEASWFVGDDRRSELSQQTIATIVELGSEAVARARLTAERAQAMVHAETEQLRRAVLASLSHDLRTPITAVIASVSSLITFGSRHRKAVRDDLLNNISEQGHALAQYTDNLLGMVRIETGSLTVRRQPVHLDELVARSWQRVLASAPHAAPSSADDLDLLVEADPYLLEEVLVNLLLNACKHGGSEAGVCVLAEATDTTIDIVVRDAGPGVAPEERESIFAPFFRGRARHRPGCGLGLFIARSFAEAMGGTLGAVDRQDGRRGLEMRLRLPRAAIP
jgi:two-component system sensor histidine kinase KdpD